MNKIEAKQALEQGHKLTHIHFTDDEWVMQDAPNSILHEDGARMNAKAFWDIRHQPFWDEGWSIYFRVSKLNMTESRVPFGKGRKNFFKTR